MNILVASGIHLGIKKDPCRKDSLNVWNEIQTIAWNVEHNIDIVVVAGDLFHNRTYEMDCKYDKLHDDAYVITQAGVSALNKQNIINLHKQDSLRLFTINTSQNKFSLMANLHARSRKGWEKIEYYFTLGAQKRIVPAFLFQKGDVNLALYGLNYMDDSELNILLREKKVEFELPPADKKWYRILILREKRRTEGNNGSGLNDSVLPSWMDLIIWGGGKRCNFRRRYSFNGNFDFIEPGNCVITDYTDMRESGSKEVGIITIGQHEVKYR